MVSREPDKAAGYFDTFCPANNVIQYKWPIFKLMFFVKVEKYKILKVDFQDPRAKCLTIKRVWVE